jgi:hypothetical protein
MENLPFLFNWLKYLWPKLLDFHLPALLEELHLVNALRTVS